LARKRKRAKTPYKSGRAGRVTRQPSQASPQKAASRGFGPRTWFLLIAAAAFAAIVLVARTVNRRPLAFHAARRIISSAPAATFVGTVACGGCHERELKLWKGSHHELAMQPANDSSVLGDFNDATIADGAVASRLFRRGRKFMVRTDGPDGALHDYEIKFTFGVSPLQQYLVEMPGGRLQALGIAWDSRPRERGGQHWFDLHLKLSAGDPLHWTGIDQNWNFMCADCHSTNLRKNYDLNTRTFATTYAEIDVACEACHGPGSNHVAWAGKRRDWHRDEANHGLLIALDERGGVSWKVDRASGNVVRSVSRTSEREIQTCARCHSRRSQIHEDYVHGQPVGDDYRVALLDDNLYFADGQIKDEVYEYGSFIQSRMFHAGVTCSDCHEPHSLKLRAQGSGVCLQCHAAGKYASAQHHFHKPASPGSQCVECHMPARTYMVVDARRDHSIRIPRPDLSLKIGVPNACNGCHRDKPASWAADLVAKWYPHGPAGFQQFADALHAGSIGAPGAERSLAQLIADHEQPAIARASALALIAGDTGSVGAASVRDGARDVSPLVRRASARALPDVDARADPGALTLLLNDPVRAVRIEVAEALAGVPADALPGEAAAALERATAEYVAAQELNADRPEAHGNLASLFASERRFADAKRELAIALTLDPSFAPAAVNLADLDRELGHEADGERVLREAIVRLPNDASLEHALGLLLVRERHGPEALEHLAAAARLDPANARFAYVYAVALNDAGRNAQALDVLEDDVVRHPYDCDALAALQSFYRDAGNPGKAAGYAKRLGELGHACSGPRAAQ
jgi:tetratricopeptide (TPR) repeat protein/ssDNA-binding Zn-finger/Zn-ribbon topoisomerase 1